MWQCSTAPRLYAQSDADAVVSHLARRVYIVLIAQFHKAEIVAL